MIWRHQRLPPPLGERLTDLGCIVLEHPRDGRRLVLDRYARCALALPASVPDSAPLPEGGLDEASRARLTAFLDAAAPADTGDEPYEVQVTLTCRSRAPSRFMPLLSRLLAAFHDARCFQLDLYVADRRYPWWQWALPFAQWLQPIAARTATERELRIRLQGVLSHVPDAGVADAIVRAGAHVEALLADPLQHAGAPLEERLTVVERLAELGLRVPVGIFVAPADLPRIAGWIDEGLERSLDSGFTLRPIQSHPEYGRGLRCAPVSPEDYLGVVKAAYLRHPYYDDVFEPVATVLRRLDPAAEVRLPVRLRIGEDGELSQYLQLPGRALPFPRRLTAFSDLQSPAAAELRRRALAHATGLTCAAGCCAGCDLRHLCRGAEGGSAAEAEADPLFAAACATWQFFVPALCWERHGVGTVAPQPLERMPC